MKVTFFFLLLLMIGCKGKERIVEVQPRVIEIEGQKIEVPPIEVRYLLSDTVIIKEKATISVKDSLLKVKVQCPDQRVVILPERIYEEKKVVDWLLVVIFGLILGYLLYRLFA